MNWASRVGEQRPSLNQLAIHKDTISDDDAFKTYVSLCGLTIIDEEKDYFILDGPSEAIKEFQHYWRFYIYV